VIVPRKEWLGSYLTGNEYFAHLYVCTVYIPFYPAPFTVKEISYYRIKAIQILARVINDRHTQRENKSAWVRDQTDSESTSSFLPGQLENCLDMLFTGISIGRSSG